MDAYRQYWEYLEGQSAAEKTALIDSIKRLIAAGKLPPSTKVKCPPSINKNKTDTIIDNAALTAAQRKLAENNVAHAAEVGKLNGQIAAQKKWKKQRNISYGINAFFLLAIGAAAYLRYKKKIIPLPRN